MLSVRGICTDYEGERGRVVPAVQDVSFEVAAGQLFTLLGPSGCGKTTTLRSIAGLERPRSGEISVAGKLVCSAERGVFIPPNRRGFGMVFQSYAIWPHMTVFQNAAFPLEVRTSATFRDGKPLARPGRREIEDRVMRVLKVVALDELADRDATRLSGGQQQRLALARALVMEPPLLLLDEPLSNLDAKLRERMRFELKRLQRDLKITTVYVTHDQGEALSLSHSIAVMQEGRIRQIGPPREIYERPGSQFVADFVGTTNLLPGSVLRADGERNHFKVTTEFGELTAFAPDALQAGHKVVISVRPEDLQLSERPLEGPNVWQGRVEDKVFVGDAVEWRIRIGEKVLQARTHPSLRTPVGHPILLRIDPEKCLALPDGA